MPKTALLIIDVQEGFIDRDVKVHQAPQMLQRIHDLIAKARAADVPVIYVRHDEAPEIEGDLHASLQPRPDEPLISKMTPDAFHETNLKSVLDSMDVARVVLAGFQTEYCINATSHQAHALGYDVVVVADAHSTFGDDGTDAVTIIQNHSEKFAQIAHLVPTVDLDFAAL